MDCIKSTHRLHSTYNFVDCALVDRVKMEGLAQTPTMS